MFWAKLHTTFTNGLRATGWRPSVAEWGGDMSASCKPRVQYCSLTRAMDDRIMRCGITSSCQSAATSELAGQRAICLRYPASRKICVIFLWFLTADDLDPWPSECKSGTPVTPTLEKRLNKFWVFYAFSIHLSPHARDREIDRRTDERTDRQLRLLGRAHNK